LVLSDRGGKAKINISFDPVGARGADPPLSRPDLSMLAMRVLADKFA
jgi:hypothetical protein